MVFTQHSPHRGSTQPPPPRFALPLAPRSRNVAGAGGLEPPLRGPKPRVLPLDDAPVSNGGPDHAPPYSPSRRSIRRRSYTARMAAPLFVLTAQADQPARLTRRWIWRDWSSERATPNTARAEERPVGGEC